MYKTHMTSRSKDSREQIMTDFAVLIDRAIAVGSTQGAEATFERLREFIAPPGAVEDQEKPPTAAERETARQLFIGYGSIKKAVRQIVAGGGGISRQEIADESTAKFGRTLSYSQITEALRTLSRDDEVTSRGRKWFPGRHLDRDAAGARPEMLNRGSGE
jgi:hypothetical protein